MLRSQSPLSFCLATHDTHCLWYGEGTPMVCTAVFLQCLRCLLALEDSPGYIFSLGNAGMVWREPPLIFDLFFGRGDGHSPLVYRRGYCSVSMLCLTATNVETSVEYCIFFSDYNRCVFAGAILALLVACEKCDPFCGPFGRVSCGVGPSVLLLLGFSSVLDPELPSLSLLSLACGNSPPAECTWLCAVSLLFVGFCCLCRFPLLLVSVVDSAHLCILSHSLCDPYFSLSAFTIVQCADACSTWNAA